MNKKILVVEDDRDIAQLLSFILTAENYEVALASDEQEFRREAFKARPDLIILDIMLGDENGPEVYEKLLGEGLDAGIPVIFLSALASHVQQSAPRPGRNFALVAKPFDPNKLVSEIASLLK